MNPQSTPTSLDHAGSAGPPDPTGLVRPSFADRFGVVVLAVTACADVAVFSQVLSLVMRDVPLVVVWLAVAGFTACSLGLAHLAGRLMEDARWRWAVWPIVVTWVALGAAAFVARLLVRRQQDITLGVTGTNGPTVSGGLLFLALYIGSGLVAATMAATVDRNRARYHRARRERATAHKAVRRPQAAHERALAVLQLHLRNRKREEQNYRAAAELRNQIAGEIKEYTALLLAAHLQDPSATTGLTNTRLRRQREEAAAAGREVSS